MIVCPSTFIGSPEGNYPPGYALHELDFYATVRNQGPLNPGHRLSMRYDLRRSRFEVYSRCNATGALKVLHRGAFADVLRYANAIAKKSWGDAMGNDTECTHEGMGRAFGCRVKDSHILSSRYPGLERTDVE